MSRLGTSAIPRRGAAGLLAAAAGLLLHAAGAAAGKPPSGQQSITLSGTGTSVVDGCVDGGTPPCAGTTRVQYVGEVSGSPFSAVSQFQQPEDFSGHLDLPAASLNPDTGCFENITGSFRLVVYRNGPRGRVAFDLAAQGSYCGNASAHSFVGTYVVDSSASQERIFRDAVGNGTMVLTDDLDLSVPDVGVFTTQILGTLALP